MNSELSNIPIVYFGNDWFAENRTSSHHIGARLGRKCPLLYVESPGFRAPKANARDLRKLVRKLSKIFQAPKAIGEHMWHVTMPQIPFRSLPFIGAFNRWLGRHMIQRALRRLGLERPILWFVVPHTADLLGHLDERFVVYYCIDDYASLPDIDGPEIARMDALLARLANQVFVSSPALVESKRQLNDSTVYSPHGVDVELFQRASDPACAIAEGARNLRHPVIGFYGLIEAWVDLDLLAFLAAARPDWTFLMIGRVAVDISHLKNFPNVVFPGTRPYESLPSWAKAFDVSIIPFRQNELVRNVNPLKLREYLAAGSPVVTVWMPEVGQFGEHVAIARSYQGFLDAIENALCSDSAERRADRMKFVSGMTWDARVDEVVAIVVNRLQSRAGGALEPLPAAVSPDPELH